MDLASGKLQKNVTLLGSIKMNSKSCEIVLNKKSKMFKKHFLKRSKNQFLTL